MGLCVSHFWQIPGKHFYGWDATSKEARSKLRSFSFKLPINSELEGYKFLFFHQKGFTCYSDTSLHSLTKYLLCKKDLFIDLVKDQKAFKDDL